MMSFRTRILAFQGSACDIPCPQRAPPHPRPATLQHLERQTRVGTRLPPPRCKHRPTNSPIRAMNTAARCHRRPLSPCGHILRDPFERSTRSLRSEDLRRAMVARHSLCSVGPCLIQSLVRTMLTRIPLRRGWIPRNARPWTTWNDDAFSSSSHLRSGEILSISAP